MWFDQNEHLLKKYKKMKAACGSKEHLKLNKAKMKLCFYNLYPSKQK